MTTKGYEPNRCETLHKGPMNRAEVLAEIGYHRSTIECADDELDGAQVREAREAIFQWKRILSTMQQAAE